MQTPTPDDVPLPSFLVTAVRRRTDDPAGPAANQPARAGESEGAATEAGEASEASETVERQEQPERPDRPKRVVSLPAVPSLTGEAALAGLPVTAVTKRRLGWLAAAVVTFWVLALFVRQVGDASAAQARADQISRENDALAAEVEALAAEKELVQQPAYVALEARAHGFGDSKERAFVLAPGAPTLSPDAPGSAGLRVGHVVEARTPLESWLEILFGPAR